MQNVERLIYAELVNRAPDRVECAIVESALFRRHNVAPMDTLRVLGDMLADGKVGQLGPYLYLRH